MVAGQLPAECIHSMHDSNAWIATELHGSDDGSGNGRGGGRTTPHRLELTLAITKHDNTWPIAAVIYYKTLKLS